MAGTGVREVIRGNFCGPSEGLTFRMTLNLKPPAKALGDFQQRSRLIISALQKITLVAT